MFLTFVGPSMSAVNLGVAGLLLCVTMGSLVTAGCTDPGIVEARDSDDEERALRYGPQDEEHHFCPHCRLVVENTVVHCPFCDVCVRDYDHHCPWIGNCVGRKNIRAFYTFLASVFALMVFVAVVSADHIGRRTRPH